MGNRTYLVESDSAEPTPRNGAPESALAAGKNCIPLYWFSLFDESCICSNLVTLYDGNAESFPYLTTSTEEARQRLLSRGGLFARFTSLSSRIVTEKWIQFVEKIKGRYIHIDAAELGMLMGASVCQKHIVNCLKAVDSPFAPEQITDDSWSELFDGAQIDVNDLPNPIPPFKLAGFAWGGPPLPWE